MAAMASEMQVSGCSSGVEHNLAKVGGEGSNPFARSSQTEPAAARASAVMSLVGDEIINANAISAPIPIAWLAASCMSQ